MRGGPEFLGHGPSGPDADDLEGDARPRAFNEFHGTPLNPAATVLWAGEHWRIGSMTSFSAPRAMATQSNRTKFPAPTQPFGSSQIRCCIETTWPQTVPSCERDFGSCTRTG